MRFKIYGEDENGNKDSIVVSGDTLDEVISSAHHEEAKRNWKNCWSEELDAQDSVHDYLKTKEVK